MEQKHAWYLLRAVERNDEECVKKMLENNPHIADDNTGDSRIEHYCLPTACRRDFLKIAKLFVEKGASVDRAVMISCSHGLFDLTPLQIASKFAYAETVAYLLQKGANVETRVKNSYSGEATETALELACMVPPGMVRAHQDHVEVARLLLEAGATIEESLVKKICNPKYEDRNLEMAGVLFQHKTNAPCGSCVTLLHVACAFGCMMAALPLLQEDIDIDAETCCGKTSLHLACEFGHLPIVQVLLNQGANMEARDEDGWTPLHWASAMGHTEITEMLIQEGAELEAEQRHGWTPLQLACQNGKLKTVELLVDFGADINAGGTSGWTPLHIACKFGCLEVVRFLLDHGCDVNAQNRKDWTPLHVACRYGRLKMARLLLLNKRCAWAVKAKGGITPEDLARKYGHIEVAEFVGNQDLKILPCSEKDQPMSWGRIFVVKQ